MIKVDLFPYFLRHKRWRKDKKVRKKERKKDKKEREEVMKKKARNNNEHSNKERGRAREKKEEEETKIKRRYGRPKCSLSLDCHQHKMLRGKKTSQKSKKTYHVLFLILILRPKRERMQRMN